MRPISRLTLVTPLLACFVMAAVASPATAFEPEERRCRAAVARSGAKLTKAILKTFTSCHKSRNRNGDMPVLNCNDIGSADADNNIYGGGGARSKFEAGVNAKCAGSVPTSSILYEECPEPCGDEMTPPITVISSLNACLLCLTAHQAETYSEEANGLPTLPVASAEEAACHATITKSSSKLFSTVLKGVAKCQSRVDSKTPGDTTTCTVDEFSAITSRGFDRCVSAVSEDCAAVTLPSATLDACGGAATTAELETCVCESARQRAGELAAFYVSLEAQETTTTTTTTYTTTSTTLLAGAADCPDIGEIVLYSRDSKISCTTNADCTAPRTCDAGSGLCTTVSDLDLGWAGFAHDQDLNDGIRTRTRLHCPGPGPVCGECNVVGLDPEPRNCRCANDTRTICDQPFAAHTDVCGGAACHCYSGPPTPVSAGGTPVCLLNRFAENLTGTVNVDTGAGSTSVRLLTRAHLGLATSVPCPVCGGKCSDDESACTVDADCGVGPTCVFDTPDDGIRGGLCVGGESPGESCDAMGTNASFPSEFGGGGGGQYSLDCMPMGGLNVSGTGLRIAFEETTGLVSLGSNVDCDGSGAGTDLCPCKVCSKVQTAACNDDADCAGQGNLCSGSSYPNVVGCDTDPDCASADVGTCTVADNTRCSQAVHVVCNGDDALCQNVDLGTCIPSSCSSDGNGTPPNPNSCDSGTCTDLGGGNGECSSGPDDSFCDGMTTASGAGILFCSTNTDCTPGVVGGDAGNCSLISRRRCFPNPITATGSPDALHPVTVAAFCMAPTTNVAINVTFGLPGPGRQVSQQATRSLCASDHGTVYSPGAGGCP